MAKRTTSRLLTGALLILTGTASGADLTVPGRYPDLSAALNAARPGDTITLAPGRHEAAGLRVPVGGLTIRGSGDPAATVLDAGGEGRILLIAGLPDSTVVTRLTFTGGAPTGRTHHERSGGAVFIDRSPARFEKCVFRGNVAGGHGGALRIVGCSPIIRLCRFEDNLAPTGGGGAIEASVDASPLIQDSEFIQNAARWGGAIAVRMGGTAALIRSRVVDNVAAGNRGFGGGIYADTYAVIGVIETIVARNRARYGGGAACFGAAQTNFDRAAVADNQVMYAGGGLMLSGASPYIGSTIIAHNTGTGIALTAGASPQVACTDVYGNSDGDWTGDLLAVASVDRNYAVAPGFCSRNPLAPQGLRLSATSPLYQVIKDCGVPGISAEPCGTAPAKDLPDVTAGLQDAGAFPNPFNPRTTITFKLGSDAELEVSVYDARGQRVRTLAHERYAAGEHRLAWDGRDGAGRRIASGLYFVVLESASASRTLKVTMLK